MWCLTVNRTSVCLEGVPWQLVVSSCFLRLLLSCWVCPCSWVWLLVNAAADRHTWNPSAHHLQLWLTCSRLHAGARDRSVTFELALRSSQLHVFTRKSFLVATRLRPISVCVFEQIPFWTDLSPVSAFSFSVNKCEKTVCVVLNSTYT